MSHFSPDLLKQRGFTKQPDGSYAKAGSVAAKSEKPTRLPPCDHDECNPTGCKRAKEPAKRSPLGMKFERFWQQLGGQELTPEHRFHATRKWRFDFALPALKIAIEIDGGVFGNGRHNRASGFIKDCEKLNHAAAAGWRVFRLATGMVDSTNIGMISDAVRESDS